MKARRLKALKITRVDLVAKGANPDAHVTLLKNEEGERADLEKGTCLKCPQCEARFNTRYGCEGDEIPNFCGECGASLTLSASGGTKELTMAKSDDAPTIESLTAQLAKATADLEAATARAAEAEKVAKADSDTKARIEKAEQENAATKAQLAELLEAQAVAGFEKQADEIKGVPGWDAVTGGRILKHLSGIVVKGDEKKPMDQLREILKGAAEAIKKGGLFGEKGAPGTAAGAAGATAYDRLQAIAKEYIAKGDPDVKNQAQALAKAIQEHPDLYNEHVEQSTLNLPRSGGASE